MSEQNLYDAGTVEEVSTGKKKTGAATAALVFGILSLITVLFFINYLFGLISIILGIVFLATKKGQKKGKARAIVGLVLAVISIGISSYTWYSVYAYFTTTPITQMMKDIKVITGGQIDPEQMVDQAIQEYVTDVVDEATLEKVETLLGKELSYEAITDFVGEEVTLERVEDFIGDAEIIAEEVQELATTIDANAVLEDLGGEVTFDAIEEKVGEDFTYDDLMEYLENFKK